jgi:hypothetical protein
MLYVSCIVRNTCIRPLDHVSWYTCKSFTTIFYIKVGFQIDHPVLNTLHIEILCLVLDTIGVSHFCYLVFTASKWRWHSQSMLPSNWTKEGILLGFLADERANLTVISQANTCADISVCWICLKPTKRDVLQWSQMFVHRDRSIAQMINRGKWETVDCIWGSLYAEKEVCSCGESGWVNCGLEYCEFAVITPKEVGIHECTGLANIKWILRNHVMVRAPFYTYVRNDIQIG